MEPTFSEHPVQIRHSVLPVAVALAPMPRVVRRRQFSPAGRGAGPVFTLALYDTAAYALFRKPPGAGRGRQDPLFAGDVPGGLHGRDMDDVVSQLMDQLTIGPGDLGDEVLAVYSPDQLRYANEEAKQLRAVAASKLRWSAAETRKRVDLVVEYARRGTGDLRHRYRVGAIEVAARTQKQARELLSDALANHLSATPAFVRGPTTGDVYVLFPHGSQWAVQVLEVRTEGVDWVGEVLRFTAASPAEAEEYLAGLVESREASAQATATPPRTSRPASRARRLSDVAGVEA